MKKVVALLLVAVMSIGLVGCGPKHCKECDAEVYKDGYCETHYALKALEDGLGQLGDLFG